MAKDPNQVDSKFRNKRYRRVRKWLLAKLPLYVNCQGQSCQEALGDEPKPLKKRQPKANRRSRPPGV